MSKLPAALDSALVDALFAHSPSAIYLKDRDGRYLRVGAGFSRITGMDEPKVLGKNDIEVYRSEQAEQFMENDRAVLETGERLIIEETLDDEKLGTRYFHTEKLPVQNRDGETIAVIGLSTEFTRLRRLEQTLKSISRNTARKTGQHYLDAVAVHIAEALNTDFLSIALLDDNKTHARTLTFLKGTEKLDNVEYSLKGTPCENVVAHATCNYPRNAQSLFPNDKELTELGISAYVGTVLSDIDNRSIGLINAMFKNDLYESHFVTEVLQIFAGRICAEMSREQKEQELRELNAQLEDKVQARTQELHDTLEELEAFNYSVSHDLRAPLRAMTGFATLLKEHLGATDDAVRDDYLNRIQHAASRMTQQIDALLKLSRLGQQAIRWERLSLSTLAEESLSLHKNGDASLLGEFRVQPGLQAWGDKALVTLVLNNLIENAIKYRHGDRRLNIRINGRVQSPYLTISIEDNGIGFDPVHAEKLFKPFVRLHDAGHSPGEGIGLASVARIIHRHGGQLSAHSTPDQGAAFTFTLPLHKPAT